MIDAMKPMELLPKDILQFVEHKAERALEVLREMIDMPEYDNAQLLQAVASPNQVFTLGNIAGTATGLGWSTNNTATAMPPMMQGGLNG
jgi:hypothetical protein